MARRGHSRSGRATSRQVRRYYRLTPLFVFAMVLVALANNLGVMWVAVEGTTLASAGPFGGGTITETLTWQEVAGGWEFWGTYTASSSNGQTGLSGEINGSTEVIVPMPMKEAEAIASTTAAAKKSACGMCSPKSDATTTNKIALRKMP